jgi:predicted transcriptional regulator
MVAKVPDVTDTELAILQALWDRGTATIRQITEQLYPSGESAYYATVQKLLERLEGKQCVLRDRSGLAHIFRASLSREQFVGAQLREMAQKLCGGSLTPVLIHLLQTETLNPKQRQELRRLLHE